MSNFNITVEKTNNENIVKFIANTFFTQATSFEFKNIDEASKSPMAQQLFYLPFVKTVYVSQNFIAIEKYNIVAWEDVQEEVSEAILDYLETGKPVVVMSNSDDKTPITIYAETTPNPKVMKFVANKALVSGIFEFKDIDAAHDAPLAQELFKFPSVKEVFVSANYVSIMKYDIAEWNDISMELREFIRSYITDGKTILNDAILNREKMTEKAANETAAISENDISDIDKEIMNILDEYVKPAVASDGGHIAFDSFDPNSKTVRVILQGACSGCPSSTITLKNGIETMLKEMLNNQVMHVEAING